MMPNPYPLTCFILQKIISIISYLYYDNATPFFSEFSRQTGYSFHEAVGRNCRFLQVINGVIILLRVHT